MGNGKKHKTHNTPPGKGQYGKDKTEQKPDYNTYKPPTTAREAEKAQTETAHKDADQVREIEKAECDTTHKDKGQRPPTKSERLRRLKVIQHTKIRDQNHDEDDDNDAHDSLVVVMPSDPSIAPVA